ncbi:MAG: hypothetical protein WA957_15010 [Alteraurantiacibacter sp.]
MRQRLELTGQQFGDWTVIEKHPESKHGHSRWVCRCSCGVVRVVFGNNLTRDKTVSCGHEARTAGGLWASYTSEYGTWGQMLKRCGDPANPAYHHYGGRGIYVCERWHDSTEGAFENFIADMGQRPQGCQIDRIDNDGPYSPENCRWVTPIENSHNSTSVRLIEFQGKVLPIAEWARELGFSPRVLYMRLRNGWTVERALTQPKRKSPTRRTSPDADQQQKPK